MKKKILLISDDIRGTSGVSHISKNLIVSTIDRFDWVQLAAMRNHPEQGHIIDVSESICKLTDNTECYARLYPTSGYGDEQILTNIIDIESPDGILHISDPRNFDYLYEMDHEIRDKMPLMYYHVWDNDPVPVFNKHIYDSCDWIGCINKKTHRFVEEVNSETKTSYIPHGVSSEDFYKLSEHEVSDMKSKILGDIKYDFIIFSNNVNIPRKQLPTLLKAVDEFSKKHTSHKICLLMHNNPGSVVSDNLRLIASDLCKNLDVVFSESSLNLTDLNTMYNICDITVNIASNEGFGLSTLESLMTETPILATDTGGLSDQMYDDGNLGMWAYAIKPSVRRLNSGGDVPYIYDDICDIPSICTGLEHWFKKAKQDREVCGLSGRNFAETKLGLNMMVNKLADNILSTVNTHIHHETRKLIKL